MVHIIRTYGFFGIMMLASWPNAAFDLCGICCGAYRLPFWQFFGATLVGKGFVKVCTRCCTHPGCNLPVGRLLRSKARPFDPR